MREVCRQKIIDEFRSLVERPGGGSPADSSWETRCRAKPTSLTGLLRCYPASDAEEAPEECRFAMPFEDRPFCKCPIALRRNHMS